jgi:hypothetical protein
MFSALCVVIWLYNIHQQNAPFLNHYFNLWCLVHVLNPRVHFQEEEYRFKKGAFCWFILYKTVINVGILGCVRTSEMVHWAQVLIIKCFTVQVKSITHCFFICLLNYTRKSFKLWHLVRPIWASHGCEWRLLSAGMWHH